MISALIGLVACDGAGNGGDAGISGDPAVAVTQSGPVRGKVEADYRAFLGIPYAAPPVGELRWAAPQAPDPWTDEREATAFGATCPQMTLEAFTSPQQQLSGVSEDCLTLNVWTPLPVPAERLPVMVWIHGGAFVLGGSAAPLFDGQALARQGEVVVVSMNYRLGPLGFLAHPKFGPGAGNYGIRDQQAALRWVQDNIAAFGGDPSNVTIFGQSAGAMSVCIHLTTQESQGLFHKAILESSPSCGLFATQSVAEETAQRFAAELVCDESADVVACLRAKPLSEIQLAARRSGGALTLLAGLEGALDWFPELDGQLIKAQPRDEIEAGRWHVMPLLLGTTRNEASCFAENERLQNLTATGYTALVVAAFRTNSGKVLRQYPANHYLSPRAALAELAGDVAFVCPTRRVAQVAAGRQAASYLYWFTHVPSFGPDPALGSCHSAELPFVFGTLPAAATAQEQELSAELITFWTAFAASGDPNAGGNVWPPQTASGDDYLDIHSPPARASGLSARCALWDEVPLPTLELLSVL